MRHRETFELDVRSASLDFVVQKRYFSQEDWREYEKDYIGDSDDELEPPTERDPISGQAPSVDIDLSGIDEVDVFEITEEEKERMFLDLLPVRDYNY